ncbi:hypothetical protein HanHA89_Chr15g0600601 [Helianthus annuus]|nr:hypothetical protein HanHA89_Chr15g0600601 [Helianthus annuus]
MVQIFLLLTPIINILYCRFFQILFVVLNGYWKKKKINKTRLSTACSIATFNMI